MKRSFAALLVCSGIWSGCAIAPDDFDEPVGSAEQAVQAPDFDDVVTVEHDVHVANGATLHVIEKFSAETFESHHHHHGRAVLMLPATLVTNIIWNAQVPGALEDYNALDRAARAGFHAYTFDWEGYGQSSQPANGFDVDAERMLSEAGSLVEWIRKRDKVKHVDLIGSSLGSAEAVALGGKGSPINRHHVGKIVLTAHTYKAATPFAYATLFSPDTLAFLSSAPNGYIDTPPFVYGVIVAFATPEAQDYCFTNCPGHYAVGPTLEGFDLPAFDAHLGRAPMLQFWGDNDLITPIEDVNQFQSEYGGPKKLVVLPGGGHVPHWETVREQFWNETFAFLEDDCD